MRTTALRVVPIRLGEDAYRSYGTRGLHHLDLFDDADVPVIAQAIKDLVPASDATATPTIFSPLIPELPEHFIGRDGLLEQLTSQMGSGETTTLVQRIQGMGGVGKTTVAAALCRAHRATVDVVWWVRAEDPTTLVADLATLAAELGIVARSGDDAAMKVQRWLETTEDDWLVVFDNVGSVEALALRPRERQRNGGRHHTGPGPAGARIRARRRPLRR